MLDNALFQPRAPGTPLQSWIRQSLVNAILDGKLQGGQRMPATRHLAKSLGIGRNTVTAAYEELVSQGRSYEEVAAADPPREFRDKWGDPTRFLTAVYEELSDSQ